jgi:hypothetical protein
VEGAGVDITTAPLPQPTVRLAVTNPASLFAAHNLAAVIKQLTAPSGTRALH